MGKIGNPREARIREKGSAAVGDGPNGFSILIRRAFVAVKPWNRASRPSENMKSNVWLNLTLFTVIAVVAPVQAQMRQPPVITVRVSNAVAREGVDRPAVIIVHRSGRINKPLPVFYRLSGTSENGVDYERLSGRVVIPAGSFDAAVEVRPIDDDLSEGVERVVFWLKPPPRNGAPYRFATVNRTVIEITDNDEGPVFKSPSTPVIDFSYGPAGYGAIVGRTIRLPPINYVYTAPARIDLVARTDNVVSVEFLVSADSLGTSSLGVVTRAVPGTSPVNNTFSFSWANAPAGTYDLRAKGITTDGRTIFGGPLTLTVQP